METQEAPQDLFELATEKVKKQNPGTELWFGRHPKTGDRWIYRAANRHETRIYRKTSSAERAKGEDGDMDIAFESLAQMCVLWPPLKAEPDDPANPTADTLGKLLARRSMLPSIIAGEICEVSGYTEDAEQKKL